MREAFSDAEDYLDQELVSADRCASRTSSISSWSENFRPSFTEKLKFKSVMEGEQAIFKCKLVASPAPKVAWFHNNRPIHKDSRRIIKIESMMHIHNSSLEINNVEEKDSGSYRIFAINSEGSAEATASLLVALKEEQNANYISFVKRSEIAHKSIDSLVKKRNARLRVDLRHVGSPFDKKYQIPGILHKQSNSKSKLMRTMYFERMPIKHDMFNDDSAEIQSSRFFGRIRSMDSLIDEDIKIKLQLLREAKRRKRFSLAFSEASFDLDTVSTEGNLKYNYADLDRGRSRSVGDLDRMDFDSYKSHFVQEQELSSGKYLQRECPEFKYRMEWILGLPSHEVGPQRAPEENIKQSCRMKDTHSLREQVLKDNLIQETECSQKNQHRLEEQKTDEWYFQKECDTREELESECCEEPQALSDQWFGSTNDMQRYSLTKGEGIFLETSTPAAEETKLIKEIPQSEDSEYMEMVWKKEFPTFTRTLIKQIPVELKGYPSKSDLKGDHGLLSDKRPESLMSTQNSLAKEIENSQSMFNGSKTTEVNVSSFDEKAEIMRECTQKGKSSSLEEEEISTIFRTSLEGNMIGKNKTCQVEDKEDPNAIHDQWAGNVSVKQMSGFDHLITDQTKPVSKENVLSISKVNHEAIQYEDQIKDYTPLMTFSNLQEQETSCFVSSFMRELPEEVKDTAHNSSKVDHETPLGQQPERFIHVQRDLPTQKPENCHRMSAQSAPAVSQAEVISTPQIRQNETQDETPFTFSIHALRHSPLTAKTRGTATFARTVIKQTPMETKDFPNEFDVQEESESISDKRLGSIFQAEKDTPTVTSENIHANQIPDQFRSAVKHTEVISGSKLSQKEQYGVKVKDFTSAPTSSKFNKTENSTFVSSTTSETIAEAKEFLYKSKVEESGTKPPETFVEDFDSTIREFVKEICPAAHSAANRDFVTERSEGVHGIATSDFVTEISTDTPTAPNKDFLAEISKDAHPEADRGAITEIPQGVQSVPNRDVVTEISKDVHFVPDRDVVTEISKDVHFVCDRDVVTEISKDVHFVCDTDVVTEISADVHFVPDREVVTEISKDIHFVPDRDVVTEISKDVHFVPDRDVVTEISKDVHFVPDRDVVTEISKDVHFVPDRDVVTEISKDVHFVPNRDVVTEISKDVHFVPDRDVVTEISKDVHFVCNRDVVTEISKDVHFVPDRDVVTEISKDVHFVPDRDVVTEISKDVYSVHDRDVVTEISADVHSVCDADVVTEISKDVHFVPNRDVVTEISADVHFVPDTDVVTEISKDVHSVHDRDVVTEISADVHSVCATDVVTEISKDVHFVPDRDVVTEISKDVHFVPDTDVVTEISKDVHFIPDTDVVTEISADVHSVCDTDVVTEISKDVNFVPDRAVVTEISKDVHYVPDRNVVTEISKDVHFVPDRNVVTEISKGVHFVCDTDVVTEISKDVHFVPDTGVVTEIFKDVHSVPVRGVVTEISKDVHFVPDKNVVTEISKDVYSVHDRDVVTEISKDVHFVPDRDVVTEISKDVHFVPDRDVVTEISKDVHSVHDRDVVTEIFKDVHSVPVRDVVTEISKDVRIVPDRNVITEISKGVYSVSDTDVVTEISKDASIIPNRDFVTEICKDVHTIPDRDFVTGISADAHPVADRDFVVERFEDVHGMPITDFIPEISADVFTVPDRDFVAEISEDAHPAPNRSKPVVKQIETTIFSKVSHKELQPAGMARSTVQILHPSLPDSKLEPTSFSSSIKKTVIDAKEPGYGFELMEDHETAFDQQRAGIDHVQEDVQSGKPEEGHDVHEQSTSAENRIEMIGVAKIKQKEPQYEAKIVSSPWMIKTSPLSEEMETLTYVSALKKPSPIGKIGSPDKTEFREGHETAFDSVTRMHKDFLTENQAHGHGTTDQSTDGETAMVSTSEISQKESQQKWKVKSKIQTGKMPCSTEDNKTSSFISSFMEETSTEVPSSQSEFVVTEGPLKQETSAVNHCPPAFFHHIASSEIKQGESCELECQFYGHPQPTVVWYKGECPISQNRDYNIHSTENRSTMNIGCTCKEHEGVYACVIFNQYGTASTFATLTIQEPEAKLFEESLQRFDIHVTEAPENKTEEDNVDQLIENEMESYFPEFARTGSTLQLPKASVPKPCPRGFSLLSSPVEIKITAPTPTPEQNEEHKQLVQEDKFDSKDSSQEPFSQTAKHKFTFSFDVISEPPQVVKELDRICCAEGESVMFECLISGEPTPDVTWIQNDRVLIGDNNKYRFEESSGIYRLYIENVLASDMGSYKCVAKNKSGEVQSISSLTVQPVVHSFICHLKDTESSDEEAESSLSRFLLNLSKIGQIEDIEQQEQLTVQEGHRDTSPLFSVKEQPLNFIPETEGSVTSTGDEFTNEISTLREKDNKAVLSSWTSLSDEVSSLREESDKNVIGSAMSFGECSSKCSSSVKASNNIATDLELMDQKMPDETGEETYSISEYLRSLNTNQKLSKDWKTGEEIEPNRDKCASEGETYEDSVFPDSVIQQVTKSNSVGTTENVSEMELSDNLASPKIDYDVNIDSVETISKKDERGENEGVSVAQYLISARQEEAVAHEEANNEAFGYDESGITSMEVEEVTFAAVYDYYNQNEEWTRSLSPESEMSIEISSTISDDVSENERFYTPPLAFENYRSAVSAESFHTPPQSPGYATPPEMLPSLNVGRSSGAFLERFYTPPEFFRTPIDEGIETTPLECVSLATEEQRSELFSTPPQQTEAKGNEMPPAFIKPLVRKKIHEGGTLTFIIEVIGCPTPNVKWYRKKSLLEPNHRTRLEREGGLCILVINSIQREDEGEYICSAINIIGEAKSVTQVDVLPQDGRSIALPPPVTHQHVIEFDVQQGQTSRSPSPQEILLEVELDEHEVKEFEKQIKIITIPEFTPDNKNMIVSLDVLPLMMSDEHNVDFLTKDNEDVKIDFEVAEMPPRFVSHIFDLEIPENTDAVFECSVTGIPKPEVMWFRNDSLITFDGKKYIRTDTPHDSLKITNVCPSDSGTYTCKAANSVGETTCRGYLTVTNSSMALTKTGGRAVAAVSLASAQECLQELDVDIGNSLLQSNQDSEIEVEFDIEQGKDDSQKSVKLIAVTENGNEEKGEKCVNISFDVFAEPAKDETIQFKGEASENCSFEFQVTETPPRFVVSLLDCITRIGSMASFQCFVTGTPKPNIMWYTNDQILEGDKHIIEEKDSGHHYLNIANITESDAGVYKCKAVNKAGEAVSEAVLKVLHL
ncbi:uncharacterized protein [Chiloscyllium punctatum]|uniref:uncharacterized protein n=1 Tax=Chiloscyllium punctatum TaxID=137246 RepID=UPI003B63DA35